MRQRSKRSKGNNMDSESTAQKSKRSASSGTNLPLGFAAGVGAMIVGTLLWIVVARKFQAPWLSFTIAFGIASAVKYVGKSKDMRVGFVSAFLSLICAIIGNLMTAVFIFISKKGGTPGEVIAQLDFGMAMAFLKAVGGSFGILFYGATLYVGFWFSFTHVPKRLPMDDL
jgi:hypothetical protein